ncbi:MAG: hypothetical protein ACOYO1_15280 [Bacteroidales bacterium]
MNTNKLIGKYVFILMIYVIVVYFIQPYGLKLYFSIVENPEISSINVNLIGKLITTSRFLLNIIIIIFVLFDAKQKKLLDWMIIIILFSAEIGILVFIIWQIYKTERIKYDA